MSDGAFEILRIDDGLPNGDPTDGVRWLYATSGTTAEPKCVRHTDATLIAGGRGLADAVDAGPDDVGTIAFPCTHIGGPDYLVMLLLRGTSAGLLESFVPGEALDGMTECPMIANGSPNDSDEQLANTDGKPVTGCEVRIVDGEVRVRGPMLCRGYTDPAAEAEAFDAEGFFHTGDLGELRPDGHLME